MITNFRIRVAMIEHDIPQYRLARLLGVSESTITRKLREELPEEEQDRIVELIKNGGTTND